jgi:tetratricopeptide (TPR) repeat protein
MGRTARAGWWAIVIAVHVGIADAAEPRSMDRLLEQAQALSAAGSIADAYALLAGAEDENLGEPRYDYALGRAALEAGYPARATLAFSRVLALEPYHAGALIDSGRAFMALGNAAQARATFESLLAAGPPAPLRAQLEGYLAQARRGLPARPAFSGYLAAALGRSSNVNQSPSRSDVFVPLFDARFELAAQNVRKADGYWSVGGGGEGTVPLDETWSLVGGADVLVRQNFHEAAFDLGGAGARLGVSAGRGLDLARVQWFGARNYVGRTANRDVGGIAAEGFKALGPDDQLVASTQAGRIRHVPADLAVFDADFLSVGAGLSHRTDGSSTLSVGLSAGAERDTGGNPDGSKGQVGLRLAADVPIRARWSLGLVAGFQRIGYDRLNPAFLVERRDRRGDVEVSLHHVLAEALSVRFGIAWTAQRSNVDLHDFDRREAWVMVRREFR